LLTVGAIEAASRFPHEDTNRPFVCAQFISQTVEVAEHKVNGRFRHSAAIEAWPAE